MPPEVQDITGCLVHQSGRMPPRRVPKDLTNGRGVSNTVSASAVDRLGEKAVIEGFPVLDRIDEA